MNLLGKYYIKLRTSLVSQTIKKLPAMWKTQVQSLGQEDPQEKRMATHSSILAWRIPWTEEPGRLQSTDSPKIRYDGTTNSCIFLFNLIIVTMKFKNYGV